MRISPKTPRLVAVIALILIVPYAIYRLDSSLGHRRLFAPHGPALHLSAAQAGSHMGAYAVVTGKVADVSASSGGTVFIDFGRPYPSETFTAVIFSRDRPRFANLAGLTGRMIAVTGRIENYHGSAQMIVSSPGQIVTLD